MTVPASRARPHERLTGLALGPRIVLTEGWDGHGRTEPVGHVADLFVLLIGDSAIVGSLVGILARSPADVMTFNPRVTGATSSSGPHSRSFSSCCSSITRGHQGRRTDRRPLQVPLTNPVI